MERIITFQREKIIPTQREIFKNHGIENLENIQPRLIHLVDKSLEIFSKYSFPQGKIKDLSPSEFIPIFHGEGGNENYAPLKNIFPKAHNLAVFVFTLGEAISREILKLFEDKNFALGYMLDSVASLAADKATIQCEEYFHEEIGNFVLSYSPGYCGWHISAQKELFNFLNPDKVGIFLNDGYLLSPLKSVSGVLVAGEKNIHIYENNFECCYSCKSKMCRDRLARLTGKTPKEPRQMLQDLFL